MAFPWAISEALAAELGHAVLDELGSLRPDLARECAVCGNTTTALEPTPSAVVSTSDPRGVVVVALAHLSCRAFVGDHWQGLMDSVSGVAGADARAAFASRGGPAPRAVMLFEPADRVLLGTSRDGPGRLHHAHTLAHLGSGFTRVTGALEDLTAPVAPGWLIARRGAHLQLSHPKVGVSYAQLAGPDVMSWMALAGAERAALVVTGSALGLGGRTFPGASVGAAIASGRVVAAVVAVDFSP